MITLEEVFKNSSALWK